MKLLHFFGTAVLALASFTVSAQGAAGKWDASIETQQGAMTMSFEFAVDGNNLTGSISNSMMGATPISEGKIDGNNLSFVVSMQGPNGAMTINYKGVVNGDEMTLTRTLQNPPEGMPAERTFTAKRAQ
jgi:hypothetical protein